MISKTKMFGLIILMSFSSLAFGESLPKRASRIDFNKMIDENNHEKTKLLKTAEAQKKHKRKVIDFKDVEVGWGDDSATLVDRRFDSVGESRVIDLGTTTSGSESLSLK